jgi:hypothetical protein
MGTASPTRRTTCVGWSHRRRGRPQAGAAGRPPGVHAWPCSRGRPSRPTKREVPRLAARPTEASTTSLPHRTGAQGQSRVASRGRRPRIRETLTFCRLSAVRGTRLSRKPLLRGFMRMRGLEPPRGSQGGGGEWRNVAATGFPAARVTAKTGRGTRNVDPAWTRRGPLIPRLSPPFFVR